MCDPGHVLFDDNCRGCVVGKFNNSATEQCSNCVGCTYTDQPALSVCAGCGSHSASHNTPHVACQCNRGFFLEEGECAGCANNFYKDATGNQACTPCQSDSQSASAVTSQSDCVCHQEGESTAPRANSQTPWTRLRVRGVIPANLSTRWRSLSVHHAWTTWGTTRRTRAAGATVATLQGTAIRAGRAVATQSRTSRAMLSAASAGQILNPCPER